jgi:hypothetical protein
MTRSEATQALITQVETHNFRFLYRNRTINQYQGIGWRGGLQLYSPNEPLPNPSAHYLWLQQITNQMTQANTLQQKVVIANEILEWGGMRTRIQDDNYGRILLQSVIDSALQGVKVNQAPMNSSYTKIASVFGYGHNSLNTIWDSRVSTALCFRLACIFSENQIDPVQAQILFPFLGYVDGVSVRVKARMPLVKRYWRSSYQKWDGHFAGATVISEIADALNYLNVPHPQINFDPSPDRWTPWKVNMVLFIDDIVACSGEIHEELNGSTPAMPSTGKDSDKGNLSKSVGRGEFKPVLCGHRIVNQLHGIHFEPDSISTGGINDARKYGLSDGEHGLCDRRILLEFYRMQNGNCKISARVRIADPRFDQLHELAIESDCPQKHGGVTLNTVTQSIFVYPLGPVACGGEIAAIEKFICQPNDSYEVFLAGLPDALACESE